MVGVILLLYARIIGMVFRCQSLACAYTVQQRRLARNATVCNTYVSGFKLRVHSFQYERRLGSPDYKDVDAILDDADIPPMAIPLSNIKKKNINMMHCCGLLATMTISTNNKSHLVMDKLHSAIYNMITSHGLCFPLWNPEPFSPDNRKPNVAICQQFHSLPCGNMDLRREWSWTRAPHMQCLLTKTSTSTHAKAVPNPVDHEDGIVVVGTSCLLNQLTRQLPLIRLDSQFPSDGSEDFQQYTLSVASPSPGPQFFSVFLVVISGTSISIFLIVPRVLTEPAALRVSSPPLHTTSQTDLRRGHPAHRNTAAASPALAPHNKIQPAQQAAVSPVIVSSAKIASSTGIEQQPPLGFPFTFPTIASQLDVVASPTTPFFDLREMLQCSLSTCPHPHPRVSHPVSDALASPQIIDLQSPELSPIELHSSSNIGQPASTSSASLQVSPDLVEQLLLPEEGGVSAAPSRPTYATISALQSMLERAVPGWHSRQHVFTVIALDVAVGGQMLHHFLRCKWLQPDYAFDLSELHIVLPHNVMVDPAAVVLDVLVGFHFRFRVVALGARDATRDSVVHEVLFDAVTRCTAEEYFDVASDAETYKSLKFVLIVSRDALDNTFACGALCAIILLKTGYTPSQVSPVLIEVAINGLDSALEPGFLARVCPEITYILQLLPQELDGPWPEIGDAWGSLACLVQTGTSLTLAQIEHYDTEACRQMIPAIYTSALLGPNVYPRHFQGDTEFVVFCQGLNMKLAPGLRPFCELYTLHITSGHQLLTRLDYEICGNAVFAVHIGNILPKLKHTISQYFMVHGHPNIPAICDLLTAETVGRDGVDPGFCAQFLPAMSKTFMNISDFLAWTDTCAATCFYGSAISATMYNAKSDLIPPSPHACLYSLDLWMNEPLLQVFERTDIDNDTSDFVSTRD
ncbi:hypothetical protein B0H21DRAFT_711880 [Amylocystis lapponica]|nr:hypothetical protein B0H21DRAFT_711880 [Amylocystis lapponica]